MIDLCRSLGLDPVMESGSGHYKVRDPAKGVYLFGISSSPSDPNWRWMIMRHLRRLGLLRDKKLRKKGERRRRSKPAIDLDALKRAQDQAAAMGHRIPTLDDLEDSTEFFTRITQDMYSDDAQEEAIGTMAPRSEAPRIRAIQQHYRKFLDANMEALQAAYKERIPNTPSGKGHYAELADVARDVVAPKRDMKRWSTKSAAVQAFRAFYETDILPRLWAVDLIEATIEHLEGFKWGTGEVGHTVPESQFEVAIAQEPQEPFEPFEKFGDALSKVAEAVPMTLETTTEDHIRERYAEALLGILAAEGSEVNENVLNRLDKLAGIA